MVEYKHIDCPELEEFNLSEQFRQFTENNRPAIEAIITDSELSSEEKNQKLQELIQAQLGQDVNCKFHQIPTFGGLGEMDEETIELARQALEKIPPAMLESLPPHVRDMLRDLLGPQRPF